MRSGCRVMALAISREPAEAQGLPSAEVQGLPPPLHPPSAEVQAPPPPTHPHVNCSSSSSTKSDNLCTALAGLSLLIIRLVIYITCFHFIIGFSLSRLPGREAALVPCHIPIHTATPCWSAFQRFSRGRCSDRWCRC